MNGSEENAVILRPQDRRDCSLLDALVIYRLAICLVQMLGSSMDTLRVVEVADTDAQLKNGSRLA